MIHAYWPIWEELSENELKNIGERLLYDILRFEIHSDYDVTDVSPLGFSFSSFGNIEDAEFDISFAFSMDIITGSLLCYVYFRKNFFSYKVGFQGYHVGSTMTDHFLYDHVIFK